MQLMGERILFSLLTIVSLNACSTKPSQSTPENDPSANKNIFVYACQDGYYGEPDQECNRSDDNPLDKFKITVVDIMGNELATTETDEGGLAFTTVQTNNSFRIKALKVILKDNKYGVDEFSCAPEETELKLFAENSFRIDIPYSPLNCYENPPQNESAFSP